jgi:hypothetical protein
MPLALLAGVAFGLLIARKYEGPNPIGAVIVAGAPFGAAVLILLEYLHR